MYHIEPGSRVAILPEWGMTVTVNVGEVGFCRSASHVLGTVEHADDRWTVLRIGKTTLARVLSQAVTTDIDGLTTGSRLTIQNVHPRWRAEGLLHDRQVFPEWERTFTNRQLALDTLRTWIGEHCSDHREPLGWVIDELTQEISW